VSLLRWKTVRDMAGDAFDLMGGWDEGFLVFQLFL